MKLQLESDLVSNALAKNSCPNTQCEPSAGQQEPLILGLTLSGPGWLGVAVQRLVSGPTWGRHCKLTFELESDMASQSSDPSSGSDVKHEPAAGKRELRAGPPTLWAWVANGWP